MMRAIKTYSKKGALCVGLSGKRGDLLKLLWWDGDGLVMPNPRSAR